MAPVTEARERAPRGSNGPRTTTTTTTAPQRQRPATRPGGGSASRPGSAARPGSTVKPSTGNHHKDPATRPGKPGKPGGNHSGDYRPGKPGGNHSGDYRPGKPGRPGGSHNFRPGGGPDYGYRPHKAPAPRPYRPAPAPRPYSRPMPPAAWRPYHGCPRVTGFFGLNFGTSFSVSLRFLFNNGYNVTGYGNNVVYLTDLNAYDYFWPDATLYYGDNGLSYSELLYSTPAYDMARYNSIYASLVARYGAPVSMTTTPYGGRVTTWFGYDNGYITLAFGPQTAVGGGTRYYTTLTLGN